MYMEHGTAISHLLSDLEITPYTVFGLIWTDTVWGDALRKYQFVCLRAKHAKSELDSNHGIGAQHLRRYHSLYANLSLFNHT